MDVLRSLTNALAQTSLLLAAAAMVIGAINFAEFWGMQ